LSPADIAWLSPTPIAVAVVTYWLYTLAGLELLRPVLGWPRQVMLGTGGVASLLALLQSPTPGGLVPPLVGLGLFAYALRRQWVFPSSTTELVAAGANFIEAEETVVWTASGRAVPLPVLAQERIVVLGDLLLVHCRLSRSLACFSPPEVTPRLSLPHASGFSIQSVQGHWDGVDGSPLGRGTALTRRRFDVGTKARWLQEHPQGVLFLPPDCRSLPPSGAPRPAAALIRGIQDPMRWGSVSSRVWTPLPEGVPKTEQLDSSAPPFLLSRWAAEVRGLDVTEDSS